MALGWTVEIANEGGAFTDYGEPVDVWFIERLNGLGTFGIMLPGLGGNPEPAAEQVVRVTWDKSGSTEIVQFQGIIYDARKVEGSNVRVLRGYDVLGKLWVRSTGDFRDYRGRTPFSVAQAAGTPNPLLLDAQGNTIIAYGAGGTFTNQVDATNPGVFRPSPNHPGNFRSDSGRVFINMQRVCLQGRAANAAGVVVGTYGLEMMARLENPNGSTPKFYLRERTDRGGAYTAEEFILHTEAQEGNVWAGRRGVEKATSANAVIVVGSGDGQTRVDSGVVGAGGFEAVVVDKTVIESTNASNLGNRVLGLLDPTREVVTLRHTRHNSPTRIGDDVVIKQSGAPDLTVRCFERHYEFQSRSFYLVLGRPRPFDGGQFVGLENLTGSESGAPQRVDYDYAKGATPPHNSTATNAALANGGNLQATLTFTNREYVEFKDEVIAVDLLVETDAAGTWDLFLELRDDAGTWRARHYQRIETVDFQFIDAGVAANERFKFLIDVLFPRGVLGDILSGPSSRITDCRMSVVNRTGGVRDVTIAFVCYVQG